MYFLVELQIKVSHIIYRSSLIFNQIYKQPHFLFCQILLLLLYLILLTYNLPCLILPSHLCLTPQHHNLFISHLIYLILIYHVVGVSHSKNLTITGQFIIWAKWMWAALIA